MPADQRPKFPGQTLHFRGLEILHGTFDSLAQVSSRSRAWGVSGGVGVLAC